MVPKALIKTGLLGRPIDKHKNDHPFNPVISVLKVIPKETAEIGEGRDLGKDQCWLNETKRCL